MMKIRGQRRKEALRLGLIRLNTGKEAHKASKFRRSLPRFGYIEKLLILNPKTAPNIEGKDPR